MPKRRSPPSRFYNTLARAKEAFEPCKAGEAAIFADGPALNAHLSLQVARRLVLADLLSRYLKFRGFKVERW